jgi:zinc transport system permease protein
MNGLFADWGGQWLENLIQTIAQQFPARSFFSYTFEIQAMLAVLLVSLCCGMMGSLVVGSRMAFFSDALAHCSFAGVSVGFLVFEAFISPNRPQAQFWPWVTPIMIGFGMLVGYGIAMVRAKTNLASDTVIGVFFAAAIGLAALLRRIIKSRSFFYLEDFLFGNPLVVTGDQLVELAVLIVVVAVAISLMYNQLLLTSFNPSLALSRRIPTLRIHVLFVMLLAVVVNLCLVAVGALLINALLIVPAATAMNLSKNLRQLFWTTLGLTVGLSLLGLLVHHEVDVRQGVDLGISGIIILLNVLAFILSVFLAPVWKRRGETPLPSSGETNAGEPLPRSVA